jgi:hypothetical protein
MEVLFFIVLWSAVLEEGFPFWCCCGLWAKKNKGARVISGVGIDFSVQCAAGSLFQLQS